MAPPPEEEAVVSDTTPAMDEMMSRFENVWACLTMKRKYRNYSIAAKQENRARGGDARTNYTAARRNQH